MRDQDILMNALEHSWGSSPEQKRREKEYNAEYYKKNKEKWANTIESIKRADRTNNSQANYRKTKLYKDINEVNDESTKLAEQYRLLNRYVDGNVDRTSLSAEEAEHRAALDRRNKVLTKQHENINKRLRNKSISRAQADNQRSRAISVAEAAISPRNVSYKQISKSNKYPIGKAFVQMLFG